MHTGSTKNASFRSSDRWLYGLGVSLILAAVLSGWARARIGVDFAVLYRMGVGIASGENVYATPRDPDTPRDERYIGQVTVYPPATGFVALPLALLPYAVAKAVFYLISNLMLVLGVRAIVRLAMPQARNYVWLFAAGLVLFSAAIRWGMMLLQGAPFVCGLLCLFVAALHTDRPRLAGLIAALAVAFKMTLALPFLGLLLLHRRFAMLATSVGLWFGLNALGFLRMGSAALPTYQGNVKALELLGTVTNINAPDPWMGAALPRLDWVFLFYGLSRNLAVSWSAGLLCTGAVSLWLLREGLRTASPPSLPTTATFLAVLVCLGSLCVYHHQYDACLFLVPMLLACFGSELLRQPSWALLLTSPLALMLALLPIGMVQRMIESTSGSHSVGLLKLAFPVAFTLALSGSMIILERCRSQERELCDHLAPLEQPFRLSS
jgi:Glycosyltransferase family 87